MAALALGATSASALTFVSNPTWSGASTTSSNWSDSGNWDVVPSGTVGTITFPNLPACSPPKACFVSNNNLTGISADTLSVDVTGSYNITGNALTLTHALNTTGSGGSADISLPISLSNNNTWTVAADLRIGGTVTTTDLTKTLQINLSSGGSLTLTGDDEVGDVTTQGGSSSQTGVDAESNGLIALAGTGKLNATNSHSISIFQTGLAGAGTVGQLTSHGGELQVGAGGLGTPGKLTVAGDLSLDSKTATLFTLRNGTATPTPGTDFGQLDTTGAVTALAGQLEILIRNATCPTLQPGAVYTLVNATSILSGAFSNAPDGTVIQTPNPSGCGAHQSFRINYTAHTVTATVVSGGPTGPSASPPVSKAPPSATGTTFLGQTVRSTTGTWGGTTPLTFTFQWQRCKTTCSDIPGANGPNYKVTNADIGSKVRAVVTAANSAGSASAPSNLDGPVNLSAGQLKQLLKGEITPAGIASIRALLHAGGATLNVSSLEAGVLQVSWYFLPPGAHIASRPVRLATGKLTFNGAGQAKLKLKLTHAGKRLLRRSHRLKLTSKGTFTPSGGHPATTTKRFKLRR